MLNWLKQVLGQKLVLQRRLSVPTASGTFGPAASGVAGFRDPITFLPPLGPAQDFGLVPGPPFQQVDE
jgi:hypothetical protein